MADNHRNQGRDYRSSNQDWNSESNRRNQERNSENENYGSQGNRDYKNTGNGSRYGQQYDPANNERWNRESESNRNSGPGRYNVDYNAVSFDPANEDQNFGYGGREYGSHYGGGMYSGNSSYYNSASNEPSRTPRNLYDRDYEGYNRDFNRKNYSDLGASNYGGGYEDRGRRGNYDEDRSYGGYSGSNYGGNLRGEQRSRYGQGDSNERSWWDRTRDEVGSWFGDDNAERRREYDKQQNHRGKGPRNYNRSDDRIKEDINDRLSDDAWIDATEIEVTVNNGEVTLTGIVVERSAKRRAEDVAEQVSGVKNVENRLRVGQHQTVNTETRSSIGTGSGVPGSGPSGMDNPASQSPVPGGTNGNSEKSKAKSGYVTG